MHHPTATAAALVVSSIGLGMSAVGALDRGATGADQALIVAAAMAVTAGAHVLPAITRSTAGRGVWVACMAVALYGHASFLSAAAQRAGDQRAAAVQPSQQQQALREQLAALPSQSPADAAAALASARSRAAASGAVLARCEAQTPGRCATPRATAAAASARADAAEEALQQARQAADLRTALASAASAHDARTDAARVEPAAAALSRLTGLPAAPIQTAAALLMCVLIELLGALLWRRAIRPAAAAAARQEIQTHDSRDRDLTDQIAHLAGPAAASIASSSPSRRPAWLAQRAAHGLGRARPGAAVRRPRAAGLRDRACAAADLDHAGPAVAADAAGSASAADPGRPSHREPHCATDPAWSPRDRPR
ncbi:MAG: hypothetical protein L6Q74_05110 [Sphaerotilus natans subsp. sulfidivorans]|uniref:hypothetical protein n=1 Tax=Sphaerotilus sulfidivorans TaxID=639200 RepID=UPI0023567E1A|nr:hypothetical protein [Sphaerotilus sulfidivorans]MCK6401279.1 hypothetical protein [Sphaerotilus sulfidivorans]